MVSRDVRVRTLTLDARDVAAVLVGVGVAVLVNPVERVLIGHPVAVVVEARGVGRQGAVLEVDIRATLIAGADATGEQVHTEPERADRGAVRNAAECRVTGGDAERRAAGCW